jgi:hypothetical protein
MPKQPKFMRNQRVKVFGSFPGAVTKVVLNPDGSYRYRVTWKHPSEDQKQDGWFDEGQLF